MIYRDESLNLSLKESERALRKAGIPLDISTWDKNTLSHAERVLEKAQDRKLTAAGYHRTDEPSQLDGEKESQHEVHTFDRFLPEWE